MVASDRKRDLLSKRRRVDDDGDDDELVEDLGDDSMSEASVMTLEDHPTAGASDVSEIDNPDASTTAKQVNGQKTDHTAGDFQQRDPTSLPVKNGVALRQTEAPAFKSTVDMDAMANGLNPATNGGDADPLHFEDSRADTRPASGAQSNRSQTKGAQLHVPRVPQSKNQPPNQDSTQSGINHVTTSYPPVVHGQPGGGPRHQNLPVHLATKGGGRGRGGGVNGFNHFQRPLPPHAPASEARWSHDLHETVLAPNISAYRAQPQMQSSFRRVMPQITQPARQSPKPSLMDKTVALGTVAARIFMPLMEAPIVSDKKVTIRQHTRLPDLRPPLRRDKPVRISLPDHAPRYIFPSVERSFIFIPRAQRPNQQGKSRGRGYGSRGGSRRTSVYGGSVYSPSVGMSRRSSMARDGMMSPAGSAFSRGPPGAPTGPSRPVVRLPAGPRARMPSQAYSGAEEAIEVGYPLPSEPVHRERRSSQMPMHHPRPQKQMSVASIEGEQQPFHHQLPFTIGSQHSQDQSLHPPPPSYHGQSSVGTPLPNIPEGAINAQPFQPTHDPSAYFTYPPQPQPMYYYPLPESQQYPYGMAPMASPVYIQPAPYYVPMLMPVPGDDGTAPNAYMQENNGMVYYYEASHFQPNDAGSQGTGMLPPQPGAEYYAQAQRQQAFYPQR